MKKQTNEGPLSQFARRRTPRQKRSQIVYDKIIATAKALFRDEGYAYVSTNKIAAKANISIGSLYQYFGSREAIALAVYEEACARAALTAKRITMEALSRPLETSIPNNIAGIFDLFEKDRYALLQLINEVPEIRTVGQPLSFDNLIHHITQMFLEQHFTDVDRTIIAQKSYILDKCFIGVISRYLDERPDFLSKAQAVNELTILNMQYIATLSRHRHSA
jgi:AcrR family transcriptional regulator